MVAPNFYAVGGPVPPSSDSYIDRMADGELFKLCQKGEFGVISAPRQMGKTSLLWRTTQRLAEENISTVVADLSAFGTQGMAEQWCFSLLDRIVGNKQFALSRWWKERAG
jgi:hypothetical protein